MARFLLFFVKLIGALPKPLWSLFARIAGWKTRVILGYRKQVVTQNLARSFPEKASTEIAKIQKAFYTHFITVFCEVVRSVSFSTQKAKQFQTVRNTDLIEDLWKKHNTIILVTGHIGNWDTGLAILPLFLTQKVYSLYKPLSNSLADKMMRAIRSKFGVKLLASKESTRFLLSHNKEKKIVAFIGDQSPFPENAYWMTFLHQPTPVFRGAEKMATKLNCPVVFMGNHRNADGSLSIDFELICEEPATLTPDELTHTHTKMLEEHIKAYPEQWLWSHRRWKHTPPEKKNVN